MKPGIHVLGGCSKFVVPQLKEPYLEYSRLLSDSGGTQRSGTKLQAISKMLWTQAVKGFRS